MASAEWAQLEATEAGCELGTARDVARAQCVPDRVELACVSSPWCPGGYRQAAGSDTPDEGKCSLTRLAVDDAVDLILCDP